ncbi:hypothetical protein JW933_02840 [candidate division FCPU426 bacterium]|nr:hypothetical protein [candidate division FCPU426 bacterium]
MITDVRIKKWFAAQKERELHRIASVFDVDYAHLKLKNEDDFFVTSQGLSILGDLNPVDFRAENLWFKNNSRRLSGSSCVYKVKTKKVNGRHRDLVIKWNRMGEEIPGAEFYDDLQYAKFNSPFEEFALVRELRQALKALPDRMVIQKPLAIYVPPERYQPWQTGRSVSRMQSILQTHEEIALDIDRLYMLIYEWIEGIDATEAFAQGLLDDAQVRALTLAAAMQLEKMGFVVRDNKPHHIIVSPDANGRLLQDEKGGIRYGLIDYELLERTRQQQDLQRISRRLDYHRRQKDRFTIAFPEKFHPHLQHVNIFGVDYVFGHVESTKGRLWVVGKDPYLFDYFQPERWEGTKRTKISLFTDSYYTVTKDNIHVVWEVSKVGLIPDMDPFFEDERKILEYGYNSPFEEVALAVDLGKKGLATIYPRAIYMMGNKSEISGRLFDNSRYESHGSQVGPDGLPVLQKDRNYVIIWGYWNGPDEKLAEKDGDYYEGINALYAYRDGVISKDEYISVLQWVKEKLFSLGVEDLNLTGKHLLISLNSQGVVIRDGQGLPDVRICNFEFLKKIPGQQ